jgi:hypothetical protein
MTEKPGDIGTWQLAADVAILTMSNAFKIMGKKTSPDVLIDQPHSASSLPAEATPTARRGGL